MFNDLNMNEVNAEEIMNSHGMYCTVARLHHRKAHHDVVFGSKLDELTTLEPLADHLTTLKNYNDMSPLQIVANLKQRMSFFGLYQLFDKVESQEVSAM